MIEKPPPPKVPPALEASAKRRARLSYLALIGITVLLIALTYLRQNTETFVNPRFVAAEDGLHLFVDEILPGAGEDSVQTRHFLVDDRGNAAEQEALGPAAYIPHDGAWIAFADQGATFKKGGEARSVNLELGFNAREALPAGPGEAWLFGVRERTFTAARVSLAAVAAAEPNAKVPALEVVEIGELAGPTSEFQALVVDGRPAVTYVLEPDVAAVLHVAGERAVRLDGPLNRATAVYVEGEPIFVTHRWRIEHFGTLQLYAAGEEARRAITLEDARILGRRVTGIAIAKLADGYMVALSRTNSIQWFRARADGGVLAATGDLVSIRTVPTWKIVAGTLMPPIVLVGAIAVITLGRSLYRDRREILAHLLRVKLPPVVYAGAVDRSFAYAIDILLLMPLITILLEYVGIAISPHLGWDALIAVGAVAVIQFVYFFFLEWVIGQSIGKRIIGIRVQREDGGRVGFVGALLRNLVRIVDATCPMAIIGFMMVAFSERKQRLGDLLGRTVVVPVVRDDERPPDEPEKPQETP